MNSYFRLCIHSSDASIFTKKKEKKKVFASKRMKLETDLFENGFFDLFCHHYYSTVKIMSTAVAMCRCVVPMNVVLLRCHCA